MSQRMFLKRFLQFPSHCHWLIPHLTGMASQQGCFHWNGQWLLSLRLLSFASVYSSITKKKSGNNFTSKMKRAMTARHRSEMKFKNIKRGKHGPLCFLHCSSWSSLVMFQHYRFHSCLWSHLCGHSLGPLSPCLFFSFSLLLEVHSRGPPAPFVPQSSVSSSALCYPWSCSWLIQQNKQLKNVSVRPIN